MTHPSPSYGFSRSTRNPDMAELLRKTPEINAIMQYESQCWTKNPPPATKPITSAGKTMPIVWNENVGLDRPLFLKNVLVSMVDIIIRRCESFFYLNCIFFSTYRNRHNLSSKYFCLNYWKNTEVRENRFSVQRSQPSNTHITQNPLSTNNG